MTRPLASANWIIELAEKRSSSGLPRGFGE